MVEAALEMVVVETAEQAEAIFHAT